LKVKMAVVQPKKTINPLDEARKYIDQLCDEGVDAIFFPEYFLQREGKPIPLGDNYITTLRTIAKEKAIHVVTGVYELGNYSSCIIVDPSGNIIGMHRKTIRARRDVQELEISSGNKLDVFETQMGKIGICICIENWFPENPRVLRLKGAEIVFAPSEFGMKWAQGDYLERWRMLYIVRAIENEAYYVACTNAVGEQPLAMVVDPEGLVLAERHSEGALLAELNMEKVRMLQTDKVKPYYCANIRMNIRRPELYKPLC